MTYLLFPKKECRFIHLYNLVDFTHLKAVAYRHQTKCTAFLLIPLWVKFVEQNQMSRDFSEWLLRGVTYAERIWVFYTYALILQQND